MRTKPVFYSSFQQIEVKRLLSIRVSPYFSYSISLIFKQESFYKPVPLFIVIQITNFSNLLGDQRKLLIVLAYTTRWIIPVLQHISFQEFYHFNLLKVVTSLVIYPKFPYKFRLITKYKLRQALDLGPYLVIAILQKSLILLIIYNIVLDIQSLILLNKLRYVLFYKVRSFKGSQSGYRLGHNIYLILRH